MRGDRGPFRSCIELRQAWHGRNREQGGEGGAGAAWEVLDQKQPYKGHASSVEDLQWSPTEASGASSISLSVSLAIYLSVRVGKGSALPPMPCLSFPSSRPNPTTLPPPPQVFLSCSADGSARVWDVRQRQGAMLSVQAHDADVNVCSWNRCAGDKRQGGG